MAKKREEVEAGVLFPEVEIDDVVVRPWSLGVLAAISPYIEEVFGKLEEKKMDIDFSIASIMRLYFIAAQHLVPIISKSLGMPKEEVEAFDINKAARILKVIWDQNRESLKNVITLFGAALVGDQTPESEESEQ